MRALTPLFAPLLPFLLLLGATTACSAPRVDLDAWRAAEAVARPVELRPDPTAELERIAALRADRDLAQARTLALSLAAEHPDNPPVLCAASRAESDGLVLFAEREKPVRNAAAASARDYAERAESLGASDAASRAQLAWALGASTHLVAMGDRAAQARRTLAVAHGALEQDPNQATALATIAIVHLRLQTLPWIAKLMASGLPPSSLEQAVDFASRAVTAAPTREHRLILARCLKANGNPGAAREQLEIALNGPPLGPRDQALLPALQSELEGL